MDELVLSRGVELPHENAVTSDLRTSAVGLARRIAAHVVNDEADEAEANELLVELSRTGKALEKARTDFVKPINDAVKAVNEWFRCGTDPLQSARATLGKRVTDFHARLRRGAEEVRRLAEAADRAQRDAEFAADRASSAHAPGLDIFGDTPDPMPDPMPAPEPVALLAEIVQQPRRTASGGTVSTRTVRRWRVEDKSQIPAEWMEINERAVNAAVRGGVAAIAGLEIYEEEETVVRA